MQTNRQASRRREILTDAGKLTASAAVLGLTTGGVFAAESNTINIALVGCGGRGTGAADGCLNAIKAADQTRRHGRCFPEPAHGFLTRISETRTQASRCPHENTSSSASTAIKKAMDCLKPGDVVILATPPAFRWVHFSYAIEKGLNVFMEKADHGGRPQHATRCSSWPKRRQGKEPQGRRRPDVPALRRPRRTSNADQGWRRSATSR